MRNGKNGRAKRGRIHTKSTLSRVRPLLSYKKLQTTIAPIKLHAANTKPYEKWMAETMNGVKNARRKFCGWNQVSEVRDQMSESERMGE